MLEAIYEEEKQVVFQTDFILALLNLKQLIRNSMEGGNPPS